MKITQYDRERLVIVDSHFVLAIPFFLALGGVGYFMRNVNWLDWHQAIFFSVILLIFLMLAGAWATRSVFVFDLVRRQLAWKWQGIFGSRKKIIPFDQIKFATIQAYQVGRKAQRQAALDDQRRYREKWANAQGLAQVPSTYEDRNCIPPTFSYRVVILGIGELMPLSFGFLAKEKECYEIRSEINRVLGAPVPTQSDEAAQEAELRAVMAIGSKFDAYTVVQAQRRCTEIEALAIVDMMKRNGA